jgi:ATP-dependent helicase/nuclease subunit A
MPTLFIMISPIASRILKTLGPIPALLEAARGTAGERLRAYCRTLLVGLGRELDEAGEPSELNELLQVIATVRASTLWQRARTSMHMLVETPFAVSMSGADYARTLGLPQTEDEPAPLEVLDGRIDLVFREDDGWVIVDYKSDAAGERIPADLLRRYRAQLALYALAWERITGEHVKERMLLFTVNGAVV